MSLRTIASLAIAIFLGLIAALLVRSYLGGAKPGRAAAPAASSLSPVVVAVAAIPRGTTLQPGMLKVVSYPRASLPVGAFQTVEQLGDKSGVPRVAMRAIEINEPILASKVSGSGAKTNLSGTLTPGMRAVSVRASDVSGVGGFVLPGDRVDVLLTRTAGSGDKAVTVTQVLAENALVVGVDQSDDVDADKPVVAKAVTLQLTPDQAQTVTLAQAVGTVSLSLRQIADTAAVARRSTTVAELGSFGAIRSGPPVAKPKSGLKPGMVEVHVARGVDVTAYPVSGAY